MPILHSSQLPDYVAAVNACGGNFDHPAIIEQYLPLDLEFNTIVDQDICPFSEEYFQQQIALYREISGRELNQWDGELHSVDIPALVAAENPTGLTDVDDIAEHVRCISTMLALARLSGRPSIIDLGAGHGLSSELFAFAGARVHAIDIDPALGEVSRRRAATRGYDIRRSDLNFDDVGTLEDDSYDAAFFYQSFHHCLRPWKLIEDLRRKLKPGGVIGFTGEPIQAIWWRNWGLRLDHVSLFAARNLGWFESGWSARFITECFARNGMTLTLFGGGHGGGEIGIATASPAKRDTVVASAAIYGLRIIEPNLDPADAQFRSKVGRRTTLAGRPAFTQDDEQEGPLLFGPYVTLDAGTYEISLIIRRETQSPVDPSSRLTLDVTANLGEQILYEEALAPRLMTGTKLIVRRFSIADEAQNVEIRLVVGGPDRWSASLPALRAAPILNPSLSDEAHPRRTWLSRLGL